MRLRSKHPAFSLNGNIGQTMANVKGGNPRLLFVEGCDSLVSALQVIEFTSSFNIQVCLLIFEYYFLVLHVTRKSCTRDSKALNFDNVIE